MYIHYFSVVNDISPPSKPVVRVKPSVSKTPAKVIHVTPANSTPRSILIPVNVKNRGCVRTVKFFKSGVKTHSKSMRIKNEYIKEERDYCQDESSQGYPPLSLTGTFFVRLYFLFCVCVCMNI